VHIAQHFGRPHTPTDQTWSETLFGHVKGEWPHLEKITDPTELELELDSKRIEYNSVRLLASIGYVTPDDEHRLPSNPDGEPTMTAPRSWLGTSTAICRKGQTHPETDAGAAGTQRATQGPRPRGCLHEVGDLRFGV
jgi:hypothetical protein